MRQICILWAGYGGLGLAMAGLILLNPNRFTSVDSGYYLQSASNLLAGRGYVVSENGQLIWNGTFPIGYSALIAALSRLTGLPVLLASKLVNYIAIGVSGYCWIRRLGVPQAAWILSIWLLGGFLKIAVYSWSETVFLVLLAEWVWSLHQFLRNPVPSRAFRLFLFGLGLFLTRYIGGYVFGLMGLLALVVWLAPNRLQAQRNLSPTRSAGRQLLLLSVSGIACMSAHFWMNHQLAGSFFGGERFLPTESMRDFSRMVGWAMLNEGLLIRDFVPAGSNKLAYAGMGIQFLLVGAAYWQLRRNRLVNELVPTITLLSKLFFLTTGGYLLALFTLRILSPFSDPALRLMAPFTFCFLTAGFLWLGQWSTHWLRTVVPYWLVLVCCSWLQLLPQADVLHKLNLVWK